MNCLRALASAALVLSAAAHGTRALADTPCDRPCLEGFLDRYLNALVSRDPTQLPLAPGAKLTENGQLLEPGDGLWGTIDALGSYRLTFADPGAREVGYFGTIKESAREQILGVRLKVEHGALSEMETFVVRPKPGFVFGAPQDLTLDPLLVQPLPSDARRPRAELVRIANSYFEGLQKATETLTPFAADCQRIENGVVTAGNTDPAATLKMWRLGCHAQFATHFSQFITQIRDRRFPIVDEERGLVLALVFFDHGGRMKTQTLADGTVAPVPPDMQVPFTFEIAELFKIDNGAIRRIQALVIPAPYRMRSGW